MCRYFVDFLQCFDHCFGGTFWLAVNSVNSWLFNFIYFWFRWMVNNVNVCRVDKDHWAVLNVVHPAVRDHRNHHHRLERVKWKRRPVQPICKKCWKVDCRRRPMESVCTRAWWKSWAYWRMANNSRRMPLNWLANKATTIRQLWNWPPMLRVNVQIYRIRIVVKWHSKWSIAAMTWPENSHQVLQINRWELDKKTNKTFAFWIKSNKKIGFSFNFGYPRRPRNELTQSNIWRFLTTKDRTFSRIILISSARFTPRTNSG